MNRLKAFINKCGLLYAAYICKREYAAQSFVSVNERPIEFAFLFRKLVEYWPKTVLDVGTGVTSLPHLMRCCGFNVTSTDNIKDYWPSGMVNRHYHVINDDITNTKLDAKYDVITCISVIEHVKDHRKAMRSLYALLNPGGRLILTCPYNERCYVSNVYELPESSVREKFPFVTQVFSRKEIGGWLDDSPFEIVEQEYWQFFEGEFWTCGERVILPQRVGNQERHQLTCLVLEKQESQQVKS